MGDRAGRAARRAVCLQNQADVEVDIRRDVDGGYRYRYMSESSDGEVVEEVVWVPRGRLYHLGLFRHWQWIPECG